MGETSSGMYYVLPTYQSVLINDINAVQTKWNSGDHLGAFDALKILYAWLPTECKAECRTMYEQINGKIMQIKASFGEMDMNSRRTKTAMATKRYIYDAVLKLSTLFCESLDRHHYLRKEGIKPKYEEKAKL